MVDIEVTINSEYDNSVEESNPLYSADNIDYSIIRHLSLLNL